MFSNTIYVSSNQIKKKDEHTIIMERGLVGTDLNDAF